MMLLSRNARVRAPLLFAAFCSAVCAGLGRRCAGFFFALFWTGLAEPAAPKPQPEPPAAPTVLINGAAVAFSPVVSESAVAAGPVIGALPALSWWPAGPARSRRPPPSPAAVLAAMGPPLPARRHRPAAGSLVAPDRPTAHGPAWRRQSRRLSGLPAASSPSRPTRRH